MAWHAGVIGYRMGPVDPVNNVNFHSLSHLTLTSSNKRCTEVPFWIEIGGVKHVQLEPLSSYLHCPLCLNFQILTVVYLL